MKELAQLIKDKKVILFVGSGVSKNLGLPTFSELIDEMAEKLGFDSELFTEWGNNDFLILAEYYFLQKGSLGALRSWMDRKWHTPNIEIGKSEIYRLIVELDFPLIYTTNFDRWLEYAYDFYQKEYLKVANVGDIPRIEKDKTQIIKFHGDFDDDSSIILTESSYFNRLDFETSLDIKLRADSLQKSILFIGYSLSDINIRYMLYKLHNQWKISKYENLRPKSFIFLVEPNPIKERILRERGIVPIIYQSDDPGTALNTFLSDLKQLA
ncbi:SIR2 family protein [Neobacillus mesonae]|uniref:SIR2 family protein n=1 Tax=Neobacillus mesonae TaxID=1193713 RepID=UPI0020412973|nr:SIR2 family protein [Neobacillus mesonae]MCM3571244.1 SIR2 family protein [Neobacillus mesonae]